MTTPAISLDKMQATAPGLVTLYKEAGVSLEKKGLAGQRAAVYLVIDRSGSMYGYYRDGSVQQLAEQALGLSANLDDDGIVPLIFFDDRVYQPVDIGLTSYVGRVAAEHARLGQMGGTKYAPAINRVIRHYTASKASASAFVIFQTDGEPSDPRETEQALRDASHLPIFWAFVGFGKKFSFLQRLDDLSGRAVDNASFFAAEPTRISNSDLYDQLTAEYPGWLAATRAAGIT